MDRSAQLVKRLAIALVTAVFLVLMTACDSDAKKAAMLQDDLTYFQDPRTNLCFATWNPRNESGMMAAVPCTDEVRCLLVNRAENPWEGSCE